MIRIAQYKGKSWVSKIIKAVTRGEYSHTAIMLADDEIIEAWQGCNRVRVIKNISDGHKAGTPVDIYAIPMTMSEEVIFRRRVRGKVGTKYDYMGLMAFLFNRARWDRKGKVFCSELFYSAYRHVSPRMFTDTVEPWQVSPSMITRTAIPALLRGEVTE